MDRLAILEFDTKLDTLVRLAYEKNTSKLPWREECPSEHAWHFTNGKYSATVNWKERSVVFARNWWAR